MPDPALLTSWIMKAIKWAFWHRSPRPRCFRWSNCRLQSYWTSNIKALPTRKRVESLIQVSQYFVFFFVSLRERNAEYVFNGGFKKGFFKWWCSFVAEVKIFETRFWGDFKWTLFWRRPFAVVKRRSEFLAFKSYIFWPVDIICLLNDMPRNIMTNCQFDQVIFKVNPHPFQKGGTT